MNGPITPDSLARELKTLWGASHLPFGAAVSQAFASPSFTQLTQRLLDQLHPRLNAAAAEAATGAIEYYRNNQNRMKSKQAEKIGDLLGSGAIESTCRQLQCRMKRCGQFWSTQGDEALLCLEMFWRNERWELLFPHVSITAFSTN